MTRTVLLLCALALICLGFTIAAQEDAEDELEAAARPLTVWLPAPLIADESGEAFSLLREHSDRFSQSDDIAIQFRIKDVGGVGGIMASIRASSEVAPGALPDLALIRQRDFRPAQALQYMQSMESLFSSSLISDLGNALETGQIAADGGFSLYGLPYFFEAMHAAHTLSSAENGASLSFADVLEQGAVLLFPAARAMDFNQIVFLQYLAAVGSAPPDDEIQADALRSVLGFYESMVAADLISADVLTWQTPADYRAEFLGNLDRAQIAVVASSDYLSMRLEAEAELALARIPTPAGERLATRDGWLWVIITPDPARKNSAARYLEWLTEPVFHAGFSNALHQLPSQAAILGDSLPENVDRAFFGDLAFGESLTMPEGDSGALPRLMQEALAQILHGESTAAEAADYVIDQAGF